MTYIFMTSVWHASPQSVTFRKRPNGIDDGAELNRKLVSIVVKVKIVYTEAQHLQDITN
jgi:hypothetical protein